MGMKGIVASAAGLSLLLAEGIGDTIRVSITPEAARRSDRGGRGRAARFLQSLGMAFFMPPGHVLPRLRRTTARTSGAGPGDPGRTSATSMPVLARRS